MYQDKVKEWLEGDARNSFKRISQSQFSVLVKFAAWLDRAAELQRAPVQSEQNETELALCKELHVHPMWILKHKFCPACGVRLVQTRSDGG